MLGKTLFYFTNSKSFEERRLEIRRQYSIKKRDKNQLGYLGTFSIRAIY